MARVKAPELPELSIAQWADFARDPMSPAERAFLELQMQPREYARWAERTRKSLTPKT